MLMIQLLNLNLIISMVVKKVLLMQFRRATDIMIAGKRVMVCGYGDVGKGTAASFQSIRS